MQNTGYNNTTLKQQNRGLILKLIVTGECESRIELAKRTGLSKMAVTNIISEFMEQNLVEEKECVRIQGKGRNPIKLCLSSKAPKMIGVHIYRGECSVILCDFQLHILQRRSFPVTEENHGQLLEHLFHRIDEIDQNIMKTAHCGTMKYIMQKQRQEERPGQIIREIAAREPLNGRRLIFIP